jgi:ribosomal protein L37E
MSSKSKRFLRLEFSPIIKIFKKQRYSLVRFERLEIDGHKIKIKIVKEEEKNHLECPVCGKRMPEPDSLYCFYCGWVSKKQAQETEVQDLQPWEKKCPGCGKICNRSQKNCLYCGWRLARWEEEYEKPSKNKKPSPAPSNKIITVNIDGKEYCSNEQNLPLDIQELMLKIEKEGYSKEMVDEWVKKRNAEKQAHQTLNKEAAQGRINELTLNVIWRAIVVVGFLIFITFIIWLRACVIRG